MRAHPYLVAMSGAEATKLKRFNPQGGAYHESWLQKLLADCPDILPTSEIEPVFYPLATIGTEVRLSTGRVDVLYVSAAGFPVIVETKLYRNPEAKREVVAQTLDMAVGLSKWTVYEIDQQIRSWTKKQGRADVGLEELFIENFGELDIEFLDFRNYLEKNLRHGRFLVAIVGDRVWPSTVEITEQLNRYPGLGLQFVTVELETFAATDDDQVLVVPRITRQTEIIERSVIEVRIDRDEPPAISITQEKAPKKRAKKTYHKALSEAIFWERLEEKDPSSYRGIQELVRLYKGNESVEVAPGSNGLVFKKVLSELNKTISLFFITTDGTVRVLAQAPKQQFKSLGFDLDPVDEYEAKVKKILNGFACKFGDFDWSSFQQAVSSFMEAIENAEQESI